MRLAPLRAVDACFHKMRRPIDSSRLGPPIGQVATAKAQDGHRPCPGWLGVERHEGDPRDERGLAKGRITHAGSVRKNRELNLNKTSQLALKYLEAY